MRKYFEQPRYFKGAGDEAGHKYYMYSLYNLSVKLSCGRMESVKYFLHNR